MCLCPACGGELRKLGEDVAEMLEIVPARFKVIRHVRPKLSCRACSTVVQAPAPSRPLVRSFAGAGLLAHVLVSKYADHLPLYRQAQIYARDGVQLERSTLADWVGGASALLKPLIEAFGAHVMSAEKLHVDDTPVPVLAPGSGRTKTGRLWTYVRDDRPAGNDAPPAAWFCYSADRKGEHPARHLRAFRGVLQVDGYAGFDRLFDDDNPSHPRREAACLGRMSGASSTIYMLRQPHRWRPRRYVASPRYMRLSKPCVVSRHRTVRLIARHALARCSTRSVAGCIKH